MWEGKSVRKSKPERLIEIKTPRNQGKRMPIQPFASLCITEDHCQWWHLKKGL